jgi:hypothetical protein
LIQVGYPPFLSSRISLQPDAISKSPPTLFENEVLEGKVLKALSTGDALLLIKGKRVVARTHIPLREGTALLLRVEETLPIPTFKLLGARSRGPDALNVSSIISAIKENLWKSTFDSMDRAGYEKEALFAFRQLVTDLSLRLFSKARPGLLKELIDKSGLRWEAKLRSLLVSKGPGTAHLEKLIEEDLKGLVSRLLALKEEKGPFLKRFLSTMNNIQLLNHLSLEQDRKIFLPIPIEFPSGFFTVGQLLMHLPQEGKDESREQGTHRESFRVTFLLELSHLGPLRADLAIRGKEIEGSFLLSHEKAKLVVESSLPILVSRLKEKGFSILSIQCRLKEPEFIMDSLLEEIIQEEGHTISLVA